MKKFMSWAALVLAIIWLSHNPAQAGQDIQRAVTEITAFASNL
jgi:hypothetical protein